MDNDLGKFSISGRNEAVSCHIEDFWTHAISNQTIGRHVPQLIREAGLQAMHVEPGELLLTDFEPAHRVYTCVPRQPWPSTRISSMPVA